MHLWFLATAAMLCVSPAPCRAQTDYNRTASKAQRFFDNEEWASANAMYLLMLEQKPRVVSTYAHAVVAQVMAGDTVQALDMVPRSMDNEVPLDSLLSDVRNVSFSIGRGRLYEHYLLGIRRTYPWFARVADNYLMQYYSFRQNGPELIRYARTMLAGLPDSRNFLRMLASGLLLNGETAEAIDIWLKVTKLYPDDYDTVLDLANCYDALGDRVEALRWMERALQLRRTPYVEARIAALTDTPTTK